MSLWLILIDIFDNYLLQWIYICYFVEIDQRYNFLEGFRSFSFLYILMKVPMIQVLMVIPDLNVLILKATEHIWYQVFVQRCHPFSPCSLHVELHRTKAPNILQGLWQFNSLALGALILVEIWSILQGCRILQNTSYLSQN